ncbi:hydantoinase/oxoprolinase family protein [Elioraea sp.]|uniref:hydantoinase/oxoprolinase family protein n=1 Tax=Elioraea sp. TaxID=2185103 RepID=UPI0025C24FAA|nr:hydantoinase/oxoprolinase family protein [Elioraea sp.]
MRVGIEVGGTFTDLVAIADGRVTVLKVPSTPKSPDIGAFNALAESGIPIPSITELAHGSTVATNAVLERKGFPTAFVTTAGFRDILALQRHGRSRIYDLAYHQPPAVVDRRSSFEVSGRILADGSVLTALDLAAAERDLVPALAAGGYRAIAICLLNAYVNPAHEQALKALIRAHLPGVHVTVSSDVTREFREFERASTVTLSAYVQPVMDGYIARFAERLKEHGFAGRFSVMQSNGGRVPGEAMRENAVTALLSGPAAGVTGAARQVARSGYGNLITLDIGGTSTDVCVVADGRPQLTNEFMIDGLPVRIPVVDINTVGAGGGSIIWVDEGGMLRVGPHSAGADPGPACYGRGGTVPTITDAHVVRRTMRADAFLGGRMRIDADAARTALAPIAERFGMSIEEAADAAVRVATANIVRAIQLISTERGHDPRDYVLVPYGGAGPLHAADVARDLGIRTIVVPPSAGIISAYGLLASDFSQFDSRTLRAAVDDTAPAVVRETFDAMRERAVARARSLGLDGELALEFTADMRFVGQAFEVPVPLPLDSLATLTAADLRARFGAAHQKVYHFGAASDRPVEIVSFRLGLIAPQEDAPRLSEPSGTAGEDRAIELYTDRAWRQGTLLSRGSLVPGRSVTGPALLDDSTSTLLLPDAWRAERDAADNLILTRETRDA